MVEYDKVKLAFEALSFAPGTYSLEVEDPAGCAQIKLYHSWTSGSISGEPDYKVGPGLHAPNGKLDALLFTGGWLPYTLDI